MKTRGKNRSPKAVQYGALQSLDFTTVTLAASQTNGTVQARFPLGLDFKILRVTAVLGGAPAGTCSFNVAVGAVAEGAVAPDDTSDFGDTGGQYTKASAGNIMFSADKALTMTADTVQTFTPTNPEAIYAQGTELTLRLATNASAAGNLTVVLWGVPVDTQPTKPMSATTAHAFNPATDL